jgi:hypothetical protein
MGLVPASLGGSAVVVSAIGMPTGRPLKVGAVIHPLSLGTVSVKPGATFSLRLATPRRAEVLARRNGGILNVVLDAHGSNRQRFSSLAVSMRSTAASNRPAADVQYGSAGTSGKRWGPAVDAGPDDTFPYHCSYTVKARRDTTGRVGQVTSWRNEHGSFDYGQSADSDISVDISGSGTGHWTSAGYTVHIGNSTSTSSVQTTVFGAKFHNYVLSDFSVAKELRNPPPNGRYFCDDAGPYISQTTAWLGGKAVGRTIASAPLWGNCPKKITATSVDEGRGGSWTRESNAAGVLSAGISAFGASMSIRSGYSKNVTTKWILGNHYAHHWFCGRSKPPSTTGYVMAGPNTGKT